MRKTESGRAMCVAFFKQLIEFIIRFAQNYAPSKPELQLTALHSLLGQANDAVTAVTDALMQYKNAIRERLIGFSGLEKVVDSSYCVAASEGIPPDKLTALRSLIRKIKGQRASKKLTEEDLEKLASEGHELHQKSSSQTSFSNRIANFSQFIEMLANLPDYNPSESHLSIAGLREYRNKLNSFNDEAMVAWAKVSTARAARNKVLDGPNGLNATARAVKLYIKGIYGRHSDEYKAVAQLHFPNPAA